QPPLSYVDLLIITGQDTAMVSLFRPPFAYSSSRLSNYSPNRPSSIRQFLTSFGQISAARYSELPSGDGNSHPEMGTPIRRWELPSGDGNSHPEMGTPIRRWELPSGDGNSHPEM